MLNHWGRIMKTDTALSWQKIEAGQQSSIDHLWVETKIN